MSCAFSYPKIEAIPAACLQIWALYHQQARTHVQGCEYRLWYNRHVYYLESTLRISSAMLVISAEWWLPLGTGRPEFTMC